MAGNADLILAGVSGGGTAGSALAYFAATGSTAPTDAAASLNVAFKDAGWCTEDGLTVGVDEDSTDINAFGSTVPVRTLVTRSKFNFSIVMLESNAISLAVYNRLPLTGITIDTTDGSTDFTVGAHNTQKYAAVFETVDGANKVRVYCPSVEVTDREDLTIQANSPITYGVTMTAYPGSDGVAAHFFYVLADLIVP